MSAQPSPRSGTPTLQNNSEAPSPRSLPATNSTTTLPEQKIPPVQLANSTTSPNASSTTLGNNAASNTSTYTPAWRRPTITIDGQSDAARRPSVQFVPSATKDSGTASRSSSAKPLSTRRSVGYGNASNGKGPAGRRLSSPPPPAQFQERVSFDTFDNKEASDFSLTLNRKHKDYEYTKRSRTFLCGTDTNEYSDTALEWLLDELVDDGDEIVCLRVVEKDSKEALKWSGGQGQRGYRREATRFLEEIEKKNTEDRAISLVLEFSIGKVHDTIQQMIRIYEPAMLVVGTRGRSLTGYQGLLSSGSVSKYCLQYSPVPVIVVRPSSKREAKKRKRLADPSRGGYRDILDKSEDAPRGRGGHLLDFNNRLSLAGADLGALGEFGSNPDEEARRVAEAIGYRNSGTHTSQRGSSLSRVTSAQSAASEVSSPPGRLLKSPEIGVVDSPNVSDDENGGEISDEDLGPGEEGFIRPEDEAAQLAYERAQVEAEAVREDAEARRKREERLNALGSSKKKGKGNDDEEEGGGAAVLDIFEKLKRGM
ncbi:Universal stress protein A family protein C25B2.10 [Pseudocercospora fuligena]|uniref:Universal stress protein A family protein C25B2.10 n=1 Tax=Pseudocercospora fuligena TaxID=685502 RepID=A0A8H6VHV9_9PEZI|nr:Universal stress protein A family protein C25B2.10 [Pseudocercospora fuligena]